MTLLPSWPNHSWGETGSTQPLPSGSEPLPANQPDPPIPAFPQISGNGLEQASLGPPQFSQGYEGSSPTSPQFLQP